MTESRLNAAKWVGTWLLQIPLYLVTTYVVRTIITSVYHLLILGGVPLPSNFLLRHFLWVGLIGGFLAGLVGIMVVRTMLLLPIKAQSHEGPAWTRPQAWTWVLPTCWLAFGILSWMGEHSYHSALATTGVSTSDVLAAFFGSGCSLGSSRIGTQMVSQCMTQIEFVHPWLGTVGYSVAAFVPLQRFRSRREGLAVATQASEQENLEQAAH